MRLSKIVGLALLCFGLAAPALAADASYGTREEAQAMVEKAVELYKADSAKAIETFQKKDGGFIDRDLYIFVFDKTGTFLANGAKPAMVGKDASGLTDVNGFAIVKAFLEVKDKGWIDYKWVNPVDNKPHDKSTYVIRVGEHIVGCGYYKM